MGSPSLEILNAYLDRALSSLLYVGPALTEGPDDFRRSLPMLVVLWQLDYNQYSHKPTSLEEAVDFLKPTALESSKLRKPKL